MPENQNIEWKSKWRDNHLEWTVGFNTLRYDASVGVLNPPHE